MNAILFIYEYSLVSSPSHLQAADIEDLQVNYALEGIEFKTKLSNLQYGSLADQIVVQIEPPSDVLHAASFSLKKDQKLNSLMKIAIEHKKIEANNFWNFFCSILNIFKIEKTRELLNLKDRNFEKEILKVQKNKINSREDFYGFDVKMNFYGDEFDKLINRLDNMWEKSFLRITWKFRCSITLFILFWIIDELYLEDHLKILRENIKGLKVKNINFALLSEKQKIALQMAQKCSK